MNPDAWRHLPQTERISSRVLVLPTGETVSVEDYCAYMGKLVGVDPVFEYTPEAHTPLWPDVTHMHEVRGRTRTHWREGFRRMIEARHPELVLSDER